ncbi:asparagine--tRNA ligase [Nostoc sp. NIES-2111]
MIQPDIRQLLQEGQPGQRATVRGWIRTARGNKNVLFVAVSDGSTIHNLQVVGKPEEIDEETRKALTTGASIEATGTLVESMGQGQRLELQADAITVLGVADAATYPLQKKGHSLEFLREIAHLRPRTNTFGAVFRLRHAMSFAIHEFFNERGFFYVHTPVITGSDAEGAGAMFRVTTLDAQNPPLTDTGAVDFSQDFFGRSTNLTVSGQLEGELAAMALGKVYTFGPTFRAENSNTTRHLAEFWMIEPEMAFYELKDNMDLAEAFLKHLVSKALERCPDDLAKLAELYDKDLITRLQSVVAEPFVRLPYTEAVAILEKVTDVKFEYPVSWGTDLQSEHERYLVEKHFGKPVILTDYPKDIKAFYMRQNDDGKTVAAMDVLFPGIGEIIGGSQREERYDRLAQRMQEMHIEEENLWWYLDTRKFGTVPHAGFGLGFERLMLFVTGMGNIRDVIPFPRFPGNAEF